MYQKKSWRTRPIAQVFHQEPFSHSCWLVHQLIHSCISQQSHLCFLILVVLVWMKSWVDCLHLQYTALHHWRKKTGFPLHLMLPLEMMWSFGGKDHELKQKVTYQWVQVELTTLCQTAGWLHNRWGGHPHVYHSQSLHRILCLCCVERTLHQHYNLSTCQPIHRAGPHHEWWMVSKRCKNQMNQLFHPRSPHFLPDSWKVRSHMHLCLYWHFPCWLCSCL